tara:strand:+ start:1325 stop:2338 length:1014 start_codon:yes stop_codon:yes gene_type:complete
MDIVNIQSECDSAFRQWADTLIANSRLTDDGWVIEGKGVIFTNYGHGNYGEVKDQVMLGYDPSTGRSTVKVVRPKAARSDKGPATVLATDVAGRRYLLREGRLTPNKISGTNFIIDTFAKLTGLAEVPLMIDGAQSKRQWFVVADLDASPREIVEKAADFSIACLRARVLTGGFAEVKSQVPDDEQTFTYGLDERGRITTYSRPGGTVEVRELQGYVHEALKKIVGNSLKKPKRKGYCVDGMVECANLLIEIKTSTSASSIYEGVGQLNLYPSLIGIKGDPERALLIPDRQPIKLIMASALDAAGISVFTYNIEDSGKKLRITFPDALIARCRLRIQ